MKEADRETTTATIAVMRTQNEGTTLGHPSSHDEFYPGYISDLVDFVLAEPSIPTLLGNVPASNIRCLTCDARPETEIGMKLVRMLRKFIIYNFQTFHYSWSCASAQGSV